MDQSGVLDRVEEHIAKYDTNKDGTFSVAEVKAIVEELEKEEQQVKSLKKVSAPACSSCGTWGTASRGCMCRQIICGVLLLAMVGFVAMFGVVYFANE